MEKKYWVPALEKAHAVLQAISTEPNQLRLIDLSNRLGYNKSSLYSLLHTMEALQWVTRDKADMYALGLAFGAWGGSFFRQFDLIGAFHREAAHTISALGETVQLARLEGSAVRYLAKADAPTPIRLASEPGMTFPAHATALGKALLAHLPPDKLEQLYPSQSLDALTPYTLTDREALIAELETFRRVGFAKERQESVVGFCCVAAAVCSTDGLTIAAVSCAIPLHQWERKEVVASTEIRRLAEKLSTN